ncbi:MAG: hypothetical protein H7146_08620 [Burkholderiaceae bacterium]|nr:hypothetical protein [Microbacteriaceae bacterium]
MATRSSTRRTAEVSVPRTLTAPVIDGALFDYVILGAGCAGLTVCLALLEQGETGTILLLDSRTAFRDDRTWCFWDVEPTPFTHLATASWNAWSVDTAGGRVRASNEAYPYLCLAAADFYEFALDSIAAFPNVRLVLGDKVVSCAESADEVRVTTSGADYRGRQVLDGRGLPVGGAAFAAATREATWVPQQFVGLRIRSSSPVFDPGECLLMDFDVDQSRGLRFMYVLPIGPDEALVENVYFSEPGISRSDYRTEITDYLAARFDLAEADIVVEGEEHGYIPMTDFAFPLAASPRIRSIGMLGGGSRPSTGYTFLRIQRSCRALAAALVHGTAPPTRISGRRSTMLDAVFLRFMVDHPERCPEVFARMFGRTPSGPLVRFLSEGSTPLDELRLIVALPKRWFLAAAWRVLARKVGARVRR